MYCRRRTDQSDDEDTVRKVHVISWTPTAATLATVEQSNPELAAIMRRGPVVQRYYTKTAADKLEAELRATGMYTIERKVMLAGTLEDAFMSITGMA